MAYKVTPIDVLHVQITMPQCKGKSIYYGSSLDLDSKPEDFRKYL